ncbi:glucose-6-phosphate 1-epimerase [Aplysia californica]|uniref:glucose-6-phosphate 1-epimerase n=1 Tax=Aplysia californica TaxID=6500 RepID=A0ABM0JBD7_APLCA|nr:glucose-6-phosphate 1-epimerase [Aplysia californica]
MAHQEYSHFPNGDVIFLDRGDGSSALVHLFGATLLSWKCKGQENLFVSSTSKFDKKKAIRGGVPVVFPNFGPWPLGPQHGFARIKPWTVSIPPTKGQDGNVLTVLSLEDDEETRNMWDYKFKLVYTLELKEDSLVSSFSVHNTDSKSLGFTCLMHTYFRVADITSTAVSGLKGLAFTDKLKDGKQERETRDEVTIDRNYDRVYKNAPKTIQIVSGGNPSRKIELITFNLPDIVVWNPWEEKAKEMGDFDDLGYKEMICVEAGKVDEPVTLPAGQHYECSQTFKSLL